MMIIWDKEQALKKAHTYGIPDYMHEGLIRWVEYGKQAPPGGFLSAVISNDLKLAVTKADDTNQHLLREYVLWFYNWAPMACWGSPLALETWPGILPQVDTPTKGDTEEEKQA